MKPISATSIKSLHVGKIEFHVQTPPGVWGHKLEKADGRTVLGVNASFILRTDQHAFNNDNIQILDRDVLDAADKLSELVEKHIVDLLGESTANTATEIPEGIGNRGI